MFEVYVSQNCTNIYGKSYRVRDSESQPNILKRYNIKGLYFFVHSFPQCSLTPEIQSDLDWYDSQVKLRAEQQRLKMRKDSLKNGRD